MGYMARQFFIQFLMFMGGLLGVIFVFDSVELMRRLSKYDNLSWDIVLPMALFKLPEIGLEIIPFAILFSCVFTLWRMTRSYELIAIRAAGVSVWQFLFAPVLVSITLGFINIMVLNPISAVMIGKFEDMEARYISLTPDTTINLSNNGLWLRQNLPQGMAVIHATNIKTPEWVLSPVTAFFFDQQRNMTFRIDAAKVTLEDQIWAFEDAYSTKIDTNKSEYFTTLHMPTTLTRREIESRFASPNTISFWNLPSYARVMSATGFSSNALWAHYYKLLSEPILNIALILLAAAIALRSPRYLKGWWMVISTMMVAFLVFFLGDLLEALGISERLPLFLSAFAPALISLLAGLSCLLYLEDG
ncbi:MAG TPA: LptF/LptG family permease [Alphaproteobacteria bacterium]